VCVCGAFFCSKFNRYNIEIVITITNLAIILLFSLYYFKVVVRGKKKEKFGYFFHIIYLVVASLAIQFKKEIKEKKI